MSLGDHITNINDSINSFIWGWPIMALMLGVGILLTIRSRGIQFNKFSYALKNTVGKIFHKTTTTDNGAVTPLQALTTALSATVGTGNIAGVAGGTYAWWSWGHLLDVDRRFGRHGNQIC